MHSFEIFAGTNGGARASDVNERFRKRAGQEGREVRRKGDEEV